jgi:hypothetical protein
MRQIKESDWKLLKQMAPVAMERFCRRTLADIDRIASDGARNYHQRYLAIFAVMRDRDKEMARAFDDLRRSTALLQLSIIYSHGLLDDEEFLRFSAETRAAISFFSKMTTTGPLHESRIGP